MAKPVCECMSVSLKRPLEEYCWLDTACQHWGPALTSVTSGLAAVLWERVESHPVDYLAHPARRTYLCDSESWTLSIISPHLSPQSFRWNLWKSVRRSHFHSLSDSLIQREIFNQCAPRTQSLSITQPAVIRYEQAAEVTAVQLIRLLQSASTSAPWTDPWNLGVSSS